MIHMCKDVNPPVELDVAAEVALDETKENKPSLKVGTPLGNTIQDYRQSLVLLTGRKWATGRNIRVAFMGGDGLVIDRIKPYFLEWTKYANIGFTFTDDPDAEVRVALLEGQGSWSYLGVDALTVPKNQPTMNFGWFSRDTATTEIARTTLHEVGHLLACPHEHQHPKNGIPWDKPAVYAYYSKPPNNWDTKTIDHNLFAKYSETQTQFSEFDRSSIMLYPIPNELTIGDWWVGWNTELSAQDKKYIAEQYPKPTTPPPPPPSEEVPTMTYGALGKVQDTVDKKYRVTKNRKTLGYINPTA